MGKVLVACEFSGTVREAFKAQGHDAWSCDLLDTEIPGQHYKCDVLDVLDKGWDLMIGHPPCTYLANSGVRWLYNKKTGMNQQRYDELVRGCDFFKSLLCSNIPRICIENPIPHKHAKEIIMIDYTQIIQPWQFGYGETKATCLWLKNLPKLIPTNIVSGRQPRVHQASPSPDRWKVRSRTNQCVADAMAEQWSKLI